ncbi:unnamed protein product [Nyctereutes procyonoides]|uniref:(raccoon dog) hypothetical protein n=1 Tax=Nyctereutes procyonoides TaxID=34880 RepID=A0A811Y0Q8_NYCPR|nr:unnamed protein product [Nyctereutes procyonoides]
METVWSFEQMLKIALISKNLVPVYENLDAGEQHLVNESFQPAPANFEQFFKDPYRKTHSPNKCGIYIQSIELLVNNNIKWLKIYYGAIFYGFTVKLLESPPVPELSVPLEAHPEGFLKKKPEDTFCCGDITIDLFPLERLQKTSSSDHSISDNYSIPKMSSSKHLEKANYCLINLCPINLHKLQCAGVNIFQEDNVNLPKLMETFKEWKEEVIKCLAVL